MGTRRVAVGRLSVCLQPGWVRVAPSPSSLPAPVTGASAVWVVSVTRGKPPDFQVGHLLLGTQMTIYSTRKKGPRKDPRGQLAKPAMSGGLMVPDGDRGTPTGAGPRPSCVTPPLSASAPLLATLRRGRWSAEGQRPMAS